MASPLSRINWRFLIILPVAAGIVHLFATFIAMADTRGSAYTRLKASLPANQMTMLQPITPGHQPLPFLGPDARYSICRFETKLGPVAVRAVLPDSGWTLGIYRADGSSVYFAAASPGRVTNIALSIVPADDRFLGLTPQALGKPAANAPDLSVAAKRGLVVVRAPDKGQAYAGEIEAVLAKAGCSQKNF